MKTQTCVIAGALLAFGLSSHTLLAKNQSDELTWSDGFLEKKCTAARDRLQKALDKIFQDCVAVETTVLAGEKGTIRSYGVGDKSGEWHGGPAIWTGVGTVKELEIKEGGVVIAVRIASNTIGFKVGDGDRRSSEALHRILAKELDSLAAALPAVAPDGKKPEPFTLPRIKAEAGERCDPMIAPKCTLNSIPLADLPSEFRSQIDGFINWPQNDEHPKPSPYTDAEKKRIVADGVFYTKLPSSMGEGGGFRCIGKFQLDGNLNPLGGIWDGKKDGAIHTILGKVTVCDYAFVSDEKTPLKFMITKDGYVHVEGRGTVKDLKTGTTRTLD